MLLSIIGTLFTSIVSGGMTGILGVAIQRFFDLKNKSIDVSLEQQRFDHEIELRKIDLEIMAKESEAKVQVAEVSADAGAFVASFTEPKHYSDGVTATHGQGWLLILLDVVRGLVRPVLTVYLCILTTIVYLHARDLLQTEGLHMGLDQAMQLVELVVGTILYLTTTCVLWWFGTRNKQKPPKIK